MVRCTFLALLACFAATAGADVHLKVMSGGKELGEAHVSQRLLQNGNKLVELLLTIRDPRHKVEIRTLSVFDPLGRPVRKLQRVTPDGAHAWRQVVATFDAGGANVVSEVAATRKTTEIPLVATATRSDGSEFWFVKIKPTVGTHVRCFTFNLETLTWELSDTVFEGVVAAGNRVIRTSGDRKVETVLDDHGEIVSLEDSSGLRMIRTNP